MSFRIRLLQAMNGVESGRSVKNEPRNRTNRTAHNLKTNNRLLKTKHHVTNNQVRATLEELSFILEKAVDHKDVDLLDVYSIINCIRLMARTPSDVFESTTP
jgi:hypothetical protein